MELKAWLDQERGRQGALARHLGLTSQNIVNWRRALRTVPVARMATIEAFTAGAVTRRDLCPDRWGDIWPELVTPDHPWPPVAAVAAAAEVAGG